MNKLLILPVFILTFAILTIPVFASNVMNFTSKTLSSTQIPIDVGNFTRSGYYIIIGNDTSTGHGFIKMIDYSGNTICENTSAFVYNDGSQHFFIPNHIATQDNSGSFLDSYITSYSSGGYLGIFWYMNCNQMGVQLPTTLDQPYNQNLPIIIGENNRLYVLATTGGSIQLIKNFYTLNPTYFLMENLYTITGNANIGNRPAYDKLLEIHNYTYLTAFVDYYDTYDGYDIMASVKIKTSDLTLIAYNQKYNNAYLLAGESGKGKVVFYDDIYYILKRLSPTSEVVYRVGSDGDAYYTPTSYSIPNYYDIGSIVYNNAKDNLILTGSYSTSGIKIPAIINMTGDLSLVNRTSQTVYSLMSYGVSNGSYSFISGNDYITIGKNKTSTILGNWSSLTIINPSLSLVNLGVNPNNLNQSCEDLTFNINITDGTQPYRIKLYTNDSVVPFSLSAQEDNVYAQNKTITFTGFCFINTGTHYAYVTVNDEYTTLNSSIVSFYVNPSYIAPFSLIVSPRPNPPNALAQFDNVFNTTAIYNGTAPYNATLFMIYNGTYITVTTTTGISEYGTFNGLLTYTQLLALLGYNFNANVNFSAVAYDNFGNIRVSNYTYYTTTPLTNGTWPNGTLPYTPLPITLTGVINILSDSLVLWTIILIIASVYAEIKAKSGGKVFALIMFLGVIVLSVFGVYPVWIPIIFVLIGGIIIFKWFQSGK